MQTNKPNDPTLEELWEIRRRLSAETPASAEERFAYYARREQQRRTRFFQRGKTQGERTAYPYRLNIQPLLSSRW